MKRLFQILIFLVLSWASYSLAATYYVAETGAGNADGTTYENRASVAYHDAKSGVFADLAGHTVYLCDNISSTLDVAVSGTSGSRITYRGDLADHNLDYDAGSGDCIQLNGYDYISLINLTMTGGRDGITTYTGSSTGIIIQGCTISGMRGTGANAIYGQFINSIIGGEPGKGNNIYDIDGDDSGDADISLFGDTNGVLCSYNTLTGNGTTTGGDGIVHVGAENVLHEYNIISGHCREDGIDIKESERIIVRYNDLYGNHDKGVQVQFRCQDIYVYGNRIHDNGESGVWMRDGDDTPPTLRRIHFWSNLIYGNGGSGISITNPPYDGYGEVTGPINLIGNTLFNNVTDEGSTSDAGIKIYAQQSPNGVFNIINNIFHSNRTAEAANKTRQIYIDSSHTGVGETTIQYNRFHSPDGNATIYWGASGDVAPSTVHASNSVGDPGLVDPAGSNFTFAAATSGGVGAGVDYSGLVGSVTITSPAGVPTTYDMYWDDALDPVNTNWTTTPFTVVSAKQDAYNTWEQGAYLYTGGGPGPDPNEAPTAIISSPASNTTISQADTVLIIGSYSDPDGDTCTYSWAFTGVDVWNGSDTYPIGRLLSHSGVYYKCILESTNNEPPNATYWTANANTLAAPGTAKYSTGGNYTISLTVNDGTVDSAAVTRGVTVLGSGGTTTDIFTRNSSGSPWGYDNHVVTGDATFVREQYPDNNDGADDDIRVAKKSDSTTRKSFLSYDLTSLSGQEVTDAIFSLYAEVDVPGVSTNVELWSCADAFVEGDGTYNTAATWNCADDGGESCTVPWTGTHGQTMFLFEVAFSSSTVLNQYYEWQSSALTAYLATQAGSIARFVLISDTTDPSGKSQFVSDDGADGTRPKLLITYGSEAGTAPVLVSLECPNCNGSYTTDDTIGPFTATFSEAVEYDQTITLTLDTDSDGANDATSVANAGSGSAQLSFPAITVTADHHTTDLDGLQMDITAGYLRAVDDSTSVAVTGTTLDTFPTGASAGSLASNNNIIIDVTAPTISSVNNTDSHCTADGTVSTSGILVKFAIVTDTTGLEITAKPGYPRIATTISGTGSTVYAYCYGLGDTTDTIIMGFTTTAKMRVLDLNFSGNLDLGPGGSIKDAAGNDVAVSMGALSLADVAAIVVNVAGHFTVGSGQDIAKISDLVSQADTDVYLYYEPVTDNVEITADNITVAGIGRTQVNTGTMTFSGNNSLVRCVNFTGAVTGAGANGNTYHPYCSRGSGEMGMGLR